MKSGKLKHLLLRGALVQNTEFWRQLLSRPRVEASIIAERMFNGPVRNGKGWCHTSGSHQNSIFCKPRREKPSEGFLPSDADPPMADCCLPLPRCSELGMNPRSFDILTELSVREEVGVVGLCALTEPPLCGEILQDIRGRHLARLMSHAAPLRTRLSGSLHAGSASC